MENPLASSLYSLIFNLLSSAINKKKHKSFSKINPAITKNKAAAVGKNGMTLNSEEIKPVAIAIIELHLSEGISK